MEYLVVLALFVLFLKLSLAKEDRSQKQRSIPIGIQTSKGHRTKRI